MEPASNESLKTVEVSVQRPLITPFSLITLAVCLR